MVLTKHAAGLALAAALTASRLDAQAVPSTLATVAARPLLYGFALECSSCTPGERGRGGGGAPPVWTYLEFPRVAAVVPGSAAEEAGIRSGDVLQSIDGFSILTAQGATRFARASAGEIVRLVFERDAKPAAVTLALGATIANRKGGPLKVFTGYMTLQGHVAGDVKLELWSDEFIVQHDSADMLILRIGSGTIVKLQLKKDSAGKR
jgi:membrane-associated protease RseP (regulator of RpoE activity)